MFAVNRQNLAIVLFSQFGQQFACNDKRFFISDSQALAFFRSGYKCRQTRRSDDRSQNDIDILGFGNLSQTLRSGEYFAGETLKQLRQRLV